MSAEVSSAGVAPVAAPVADSGAPAAPQRSETQQAALAAVDALRADIAKAGGKATPEQMARLNTLWRHGHAVDATVPLELRTKPAEDHREADALRDKIEAETAPISAEQSERLLARAKVQGVNPQLAEAMVSMTQQLGLDEAAASTVMARVAKHGDINVLDDSGVAEYSEEAARLYGSAEKFERASERARAFLASKGVLADFDRLGLTRSSLAFDPRLLNALAAAADREEIK